jgi:hypothetical protein
VLRPPGVVLAIIGALAVAPTLGGQALPSDALETAPGPLVAGNPRLTASLDRIAKGSALWRAEVGTVRQSRARVVVLGADQVVVADTAGKRPQPFDPSVLAGVSVVTGESTQIDAVVVVVNLALLDQIHWRRGSVPAQRDADLDRILVHEVYGHAIPYLIAGDLSGRCADPADGQRAIDACSIRRENAVRAELGLGRRVDPGLKGLDLGRAATSVLSRFEVPFQTHP